MKYAGHAGERERERERERKIKLTNESEKYGDILNR